MRRAVVVSGAAGLAVAGWAGSAVAAGSGWGVSVTGHRDRIGYAIHSPVTVTSGPGTGGRSSAAAGGAPGSAGSSGSSAPYYWAGFAIGAGPHGTPCVQPVFRQFSSTRSAAHYVASPALQAVWLYRLSRVGGRICSSPAVPGTTGKTAGAQPGFAAARWWSLVGSRELPPPAPYVAPGWALAGNPAYLVDRGPASRAFSVPAGGLGTLEVHASSVLYVDWGDGRTSGPFRAPGLPWPSGDINHVWQDAGTYRVTVTQDWFATWRLGGQSGYLQGLSTTAVLPAFEVRPLVAVRNR